MSVMLDIAKTTNQEPWKQYICIACGLIYDEKEGDLDSGLAPGTRFDDIPDDWECPVCGVTKKDFTLFVKQERTEVASSVLIGREIGIVIIGGGMAGWAMAEAIRMRDQVTPVTMITACSGDRYNKPELSVSFSRLPSRESLVRATADIESQRLGVKLVNYTQVVSVSSSLHQVRTTRGTFSYKQLVIAQGSKTVLPDNLPAHLCWRVNLLSDWSELLPRLQAEPKRIAIIGAGMVGCELAEDMCRMGHSVFLMSRNSQPLINMLPIKAGQRLMAAQKKLGITFLDSRKIAQILPGKDGGKTLIFSTGDDLRVDEVVATTGVATDRRIAERAQLEFDNGIVVNSDTLQTSQEDIYAIGDCVSFNGTCNRYVGLIDQQVNVVAEKMLNKTLNQTYKNDLPPIVLKTKSCPVEISGVPEVSGDWTVVEDSESYLFMTQGEKGNTHASIKVGRAA